jgi:hypothetical protein
VCATLTAGGSTQVRFTNAVPQGQLKVCKVGGTGVPEGTAFTFSVRDTGTGVTSSVTVPAGQCALAGHFADATSVEVTENVPVGTEVADRQVTPITWLQTCAAPQSNRACARIGAGQVTHVTFTDRKPPANGGLELCKVAGTGGVTGSYSFSVRVLPNGPTQTLTVAVGACVTIPNLPVSTLVEITETVPVDQIASLSVSPADEARPCPTPAVARICVNVTSAVPRVTATNRKPISAVELCKVAGSTGVTGSYSFTVRVLPNGTPQTVTVATGACATIQSLPVDAVVEITETVPVGQTAALTVTPADQERPCPTPAAGRICVNVSGAVPRVTATNSRTNTTGTLRLCKVAGPGIVSGAPYTFSVRQIATGDTQSQTVLADSCVLLLGFPGDSTVEVTETLVPGNLAPTIAVDPVSAVRTCPLPMLIRACANIPAGSTVEVRFTNRAPG